MTDILDAVWFVARWAALLALPAMGVIAFVLAVKETVREYRDARQIERLTDVIDISARGRQP